MWQTWRQSVIKNLANYPPCVTLVIGQVGIGTIRRSSVRLLILKQTRKHDIRT